MIYVIDLFCGAGGFSQGAVDAGATVVLGVDNWPEALAIHAANHAHTEHWCLELGGCRETFVNELKGFIEMKGLVGRHVHIHASPPCQNLTSHNHKAKDKHIATDDLDHRTSRSP